MKKNPDIPQHLSEARRHIETGAFDNALSECRKAIKKDPNAMEPRELECNILVFGLKDYEAAVKTCTRALSVSKKDVEIHLNLGIAYRHLEEYDKALSVYDAGLRIAPKDPLLWFDKGLALAYANRHESAVECYDKAIGLGYKKKNKALYRKAISLDETGRPGEAVAILRRLLKKDPDNVDILHNIAFVSQKMGDLEDAVKYYGVVIWLTKKDAEAFNSRGDCRLVLGEVHEAIADYEKAFSLEPSNELYAFNLMNAYGRTGKVNEAVKVVRKFFKKLLS